MISFILNHQKNNNGKMIFLIIIRNGREYFELSGNSQNESGNMTELVMIKI